MKKKFSLLLILSLTSVVSLGLADDSSDPVQLLGQFVQSSYAASKCIKPEQTTLNNFAANFKVAYKNAVQDLKVQHPEQTDTELADQLNTRTKAVEQKIDAAITSQGCEDRRVQELISRFAELAKLRL